MTLWYITRGTGIVALLLLTGSVVLGVVNQTRWRSRKWPRFALQDIHRNISLLALAVVFVHVSTSVVDRFAPIGWKDSLIPFLSPYRPLWLGFGTLSADLFLAVLVTSLLRPRISPRLWRAVHWLSYASWPTAVLHSAGTGTDARVGWMLVPTALCVAAVVLAVWWRLAIGWPRDLVWRVAGMAASVLVPIALVAFVVAGPLRPGWARAAGTPSSLLGSSSAARATTVPRQSLPSLPFTTSFRGHLTERGSEEESVATISITGLLDGGSKGVLRIAVRGTPLEGGGVAMTDGAGEFGPIVQQDLYQGNVVSLEGTTIVLHMTAAGHEPITLIARFSIGDSSAVTGVVSAQVTDG